MSIALAEANGTSTVSDDDGTYRLVAPLGPQELTLTKAADRSGVIDATDAVHVLEALSRMRELDSIQESACDVDGNRRLDRRDAEQILDYVLGTRSRLDVGNLCQSDWLFFPNPDRSALSAFELAAARDGCPAREPSIDAERFATQDFQAVLIGNCSGEWPTATPSGALTTVDGRLATIGPPRRGRSGRMRVPINIDADAAFTAAEVRLTFDAEESIPRLRARHRTRHRVIRYYADDDGTLTIVIASATPHVPGTPIELLLDLVPRVRTRTVVAAPIVTRVRLNGGR